MSFATNLRFHRTQKKLSLQKLADLIGVSKAHIWDLETERATNPSLEVLRNLSNVLDVPIATLVGEDVQSAPPSDDSVVLFRNLQSLDPEDRETIKMMMQRLQRRTGKDKE